MVTGADLKKWKHEDLTPYLDVVVGVFGTKRVMFDSDWPVCSLAGEYKKVLKIVTDILNN